MAATLKDQQEKEKYVNVKTKKYQTTLKVRWKILARHQVGNRCLGVLVGLLH